MIQYIKAEHLNVQGKKEDIYRVYGDTYEIAPLGGSKNWILKKSSDVLINGVSCRQKVLEYYNRSCLSRTLIERLMSDFASGAITEEMLTSP